MSNTWSFNPSKDLSFGGLYAKDAEDRIWRPKTNILSPAYSVSGNTSRNQRTSSFSASVGGRPSLCSSSGDCGAGFVCSGGVCVPSGGGNTYPGYSGTGCNTGPGGVDAGTPTNNCGGQSGTALGDCYQAGCGQGGNVGCASDSGPRCCRYSAGKKVQCYKGSCPPEPYGCSSYCTGHKASYGDSGPSCDNRNECSECTACEDGQCVDKADKPCHCDESCEPPGPILYCCNYKDTCNGREEGTYCQSVPFSIRPYPKCYDPSTPCAPGPGPGSCFECDTSYGPSVPQGCSTTGTISAGGQTLYTYSCCEPSTSPECTPKLYARWQGTVYQAGYFSPPSSNYVVGPWVDISADQSIGLVDNINAACVEGFDGAAWAGSGTASIKVGAGTGCDTACFSCAVMVVRDYLGNQIQSYISVGYSWFYPSQPITLWSVQGAFDFSYNQQDIIASRPG